MLQHRVNALSPSQQLIPSNCLEAQRALYIRTGISTISRQCRAREKLWILPHKDNHIKQRVCILNTRQSNANHNIATQTHYVSPRLISIKYDLKIETLISQALTSTDEVIVHRKQSSTGEQFSSYFESCIYIVSTITGNGQEIIIHIERLRFQFLDYFQVLNGNSLRVDTSLYTGPGSTLLLVKFQDAA